MLTTIVYITITLLLLSSFYKHRIKEPFYAHNSSNIPRTNEISYYKLEIDMLKELVNTYFGEKESLLTFEQDYDVKYFYLHKFRDIVLKELANVLGTSELFKDYKLNIKENIDIFYKGIDGHNNDSYYKFDVEIFATNKPFSFKAQIILKVANMKTFLTPDGMYQDIIPLDDKAIRIDHVHIYDYVSPIKLVSESNLDATNFYKIKSKLYIFDPSIPN